MGSVNCLLYILAAFIINNATASNEKPNFVIILTDDQDIVLNGMTPMKSTKDLIAKKGTTFINSYVAAPICCPSRSSILTGMYVHNHQATNNSLSGNCSSIEWQKNYEPKSFANILNKQGYDTFYGGKYLNEYGNKHAGGSEHIPPGWSRWRGLLGNSRYYNFTLSHDGVEKSYNNGEYLTDVIRDEALEFINLQYRQGYKKPFLVFISPPAPHAPFIPAPRHKNTFRGIKALRTPNFNIPVEDDKHWLLQSNPSPLPDTTVESLDDIYRSRWETLLSVDEAVNLIIQSLTKYKMIDDTYLIFTSDNGYHIGQFSQPFDKRQPYETDIKVPLIIRGPNVQPGYTSLLPTINIDLAPTILKLAGVSKPDYMDGEVLPIFGDTIRHNDNSIETNDINMEVYERHMLVEYHGKGSERNSSDCPASYDKDMFNCLPEYLCKCQDARNNTFGCVRHLHPMIDFVYCAFTDSLDFEEAYDLQMDPYQMNNVINDILPAVKFKYQNILEHLSECKGESCNVFNQNSV